MRRNLSQELIFPVRSVQDESGKRRNHNFIECSHCPETASVPINVSAGAMGEEVLTRRFTRQGWYVSRVAGGHLCPSCNPTKKRAVVTTTSKPTSEPKIEEKTVAARELTFADRRIINTKLEETYENELVGYRAGWSDEKVAKDLGVTLVWVTELRTANFGPADGNRAVVELRVEQDRLVKDMADWRRQGDALNARLIELTGKVGQIGAKAAA